MNVSNSPVTASASGTNIAITYKTVGTAGNAAVTINSSTSQSSYFSSPSFTSAGTTLGGGFNPQGPSLDHAFYVTQYFYDALGNLLCVEQHGNVAGTGCSAPPSSDSSSPWRVRRFTYDSLSRLLTANNPESGLISYQYDNDGNLLQKTSPQANQTGSATTTISYCYDAVHRITGKAYSAQSCPLSSPAVTLTYDQGTNAIGHLTGMTDASGSTSYNYDTLGRLITEQRTLAGITKNVSYTYNLDGSVATVTYPSGAVIAYAPDSAGRVLSATDSGNSINYVTGATYGPDNALTGFVSGHNSTFAGITNSFSYNKRLQSVNMAASSPSQTVFSINYDFHLGSGNNGNVWGIVNNRDSSRNQIFTYDPLNRLLSAQNAGTDCTKTLPDGHTEYWGNSYVYDPWGNLNQKQVTKCSAENLSLTIAANNRAQGGSYLYDAAGNMLRDNNGTNYTYDPENRISSTAGYTYIYDGDGNRVKKSNSTTGTLYWHASPGIIAESDLSGNIQHEYVFFGGERVARKDAGNQIFYYFSDHLKTASVVTDATGNVKNESDYYPWGGELQYANNDPANHYKFTGKERDQESGLDYFGARYYGNALGRFLTPDWAAKATTVPYAQFGNPQTLNLYGYVGGNPASKADPDGHCPPCAEVVEGAELGAEIGSWAGPMGTAAGAVGGGVSAAVGLGWVLHKADQWMSSSNSSNKGNAPQGSDYNHAAKPGQIPKGNPAPANAGTGAHSTPPVPGGGQNGQRGTNKPGEKTSRTSLRKGTVQEAWNQAEDGRNGGKVCPDCGREVKVEPGSGQPRDWDVNHDPKWAEREFDENATRQDVRDNYQEGTSLRCQTCNRSDNQVSPQQANPKPPE